MGSNTAKPRPVDCRLKESSSKRDKRHHHHGNKICRQSAHKELGGKHGFEGQYLWSFKRSMKCLNNRRQQHVVCCCVMAIPFEKSLVFDAKMKRTVNKDVRLACKDRSSGNSQWRACDGHLREYPWMNVTQPSNQWKGKVSVVRDPVGEAVQSKQVPRGKASVHPYR
jgi:hypothetical protein